MSSEFQMYYSSLVPPLHKFAIQNLDLFFPFFGKLDLFNSAVYLLTCKYFGRMEKNCPVAK